MLKTFGARNGPGHRITLHDRTKVNQLAPDDTGRRAELDYVLIRSNGGVTGRWMRHVIRHEGRDLSYRYAVGASFTFEEGK
jgi:hypothetical protein